MAHDRYAAYILCSSLNGFCYILIYWRMYGGGVGVFISSICHIVKEIYIYINAIDENNGNSAIGRER